MPVGLRERIYSLETMTVHLMGMLHEVGVLPLEIMRTIAENATKATELPADQRESFAWWAAELAELERHKVRKASTPPARAPGPPQLRLVPQPTEEDE